MKNKWGQENMNKISRNVKRKNEKEVEKDSSIHLGLSKGLKWGQTNEEHTLL